MCSSPSLYTLITKALSEQLICSDHNLPLSFLSKDLQLVCQQCQQIQYLHPLQSFFQNPISLILWYNNSSQKHSSQWFQKNIQQNIESKLESSKNTLKLYLQQLQTTVSKYCNSILEQYQYIVNNIIESSSKSLSKLQKINQLYCYQLYQQINQNSLSLSFITNLITNFITVNQNPSHKLTSEINEVSKYLSQFPYLNTQKLTSHFQELCDPFKWKLSNFILNHHSSKDELFDMANSIHLSDNKHYLKYGEEGIGLYSFENKSPLNVCRISIDDCYQINGYKVYGYNAEEIVILSYLDPKEIKIVKRVRVKFPTDVAYESPYLYYKSEGVYWKWNIAMGEPEQLSKSTNSQFMKTKDSLFKFLEYKEPVELNIENNFVTLS